MADEIEITATDDLPAPLAWDRQERPFRPPSRARAWKVRRHTKGRPVIVRDDRGQPVFLPLSASLESFEAMVGHAPGLYRLYLVDETHRELEDAPVAYVLIEGEEPDASTRVQLEQQQELISRLVTTIERQSSQMTQIAERLVTSQAALMTCANETIRIANGVQPHSVEVNSETLMAELNETLAASQKNDQGGFWKVLFQSPVLPALLQGFQKVVQAQAQAAQAQAAQAQAAAAAQAKAPEPSDD